MKTHDDQSERSKARFDRSHEGTSEGHGNGETGDSSSGHRGRRHRHHHHRSDGRKERVLHTRISEQLSEDIRRLADDLRVPASNLVRNVLEEVFAMVESVSEDVGELFEDVLDEASEARDRMSRRASRHRTSASRGFGQGRAGRSDDGVEQELRRDEAAEGSGSPAEDERGPEATVRPEPATGQRVRPVFPEVLGWQSLVLNHDRTCASCGVELRRGSHACIGLGAQGLTDATLCRACAGIRD